MNDRILHTMTRITDTERQALVAALGLVPYTSDREIADRIRSGKGDGGFVAPNPLIIGVFPIPHEE